MAYTPIWRHRKDEILQIAADVRAAHPDAWDELKVHGQTSRKYINLVSMALIAAGIPGGVNLKRGGPQESIDAIALPNASGAGDSTNTYQGLEIIDIVGGAEGPTPSLSWGDVTQATIDAGTRGGWKAGSVTPGPTPIPTFPYPDENTAGKAFQVRVKQAYTDAGRQFPDPNDQDAFRHYMRYGYSSHEMPEPQAADKHIAELRAQLGV